MDVSLCDTDTLNLKAVVENGNYSWYSNGNLIGDNEAVLILNDTGAINLELIAYNGVCQISVKQIINVKACDLLYIPNAFTPDGDGLNDSFAPKGTTANWDLEIYSRWGELIFKDNKPWSGNGISGVYAFKLSWVQNKKTKIVLGRVTLIL